MEEKYEFVEINGSLINTRHVVIGNNVTIYPGCVIGGEAEHKTKKSIGKIFIGEGTVIRENVVIQRGTERSTRIGRNCYIMHGVHIAHDCVIEDEVTIAPGTVFAGHCMVMNNATIGINCSFHQYTTVGSYSMVGMGSVVTKDVRPYSCAYGNPAYYRGVNKKYDKPVPCEDDKRFEYISRRDVMSFPGDKEQEINMYGEEQ